MASSDYRQIFADTTMALVLPPERSDEFFDALFGDASEGAYTISLHFAEYSQSGNELLFELRLNQRPGKCLACNLTYGLPEVFSRHPIINLNGVVEEICSRLGSEKSCKSWRLGKTRTTSSKLHIIPLHITLNR